MSDNLSSIVTQVNIYKKNDNPIFGESVISISVCDEAAGPYLNIRQINENMDYQLNIEFDELDEFIKVCTSLRDSFKDLN